MDFAAARQNMVDGQIATNKITNPQLLDAVGSIPRETFIPAASQGYAYVDEAIALGGGRYLMEPLLATQLIDAANIGPDDLVLVVGAASGYETALIAQLAGTVVALESDSGLVAKAEAALSELGVDTAALIEGSFAEGYSAQAPYDCIIINGAVTQIPDTLTAQLVDGGRLVSVVQDADNPHAPGNVVVCTRQGDDIGQQVIFNAGTPLLPGFETAAGFSFG